ncbi:hypothetical protein JMUB6875_77270 [Nocardia sp. JMUB6875]
MSASLPSEPNATPIGMKRSPPCASQLGVEAGDGLDTGVEGGGGPDCAARGSRLSVKNLVRQGRRARWAPLSVLGSSGPGTQLPGVTPLGGPIRARLLDPPPADSANGPDKVGIVPIG